MYHRNVSYLWHESPSWCSLLANLEGAASTSSHGTGCGWTDYQPAPRCSCLQARPCQSASDDHLRVHMSRVICFAVCGGHVPHGAKLPSADSDKLILVASLSRSPDACNRCHVSPTFGLCSAMFVLEPIAGRLQQVPRAAYICAMFG